MADPPDPPSGGSTSHSVGWWVKLGAITAFITAVTGLLGQVTGLWGFLFDSPNDTEPNDTEANDTEPLNSLQQVAGSWIQVEWIEVQSPITIGMVPLHAELELTEAGQATWDMDVHDVAFPSPDGGLSCSGTLSLEDELEGTATEIRDFTPNMVSLRREILLAFCGGGVFDEFDNFTFSHDGSVERAATTLEMENSRGRFVWQRPAE